MSLTAPLRQGQLAIEPAAAAVEVVPGTPASVEARVVLHLSPKPLKGEVHVSSSDLAFAIEGASEVRRTEREIELEVSGAFRVTEPRAVALTYTVDGLSAVQQVTFTPAAAAPDAPRLYQRYVPFEDDEPQAVSHDTGLAPARVAAAPAQRRAGSVEIAVAPALARASGALAELVCNVGVGTVVWFALAIAVGLSLAPVCGSGDYAPGSGCAATEDALVNGIVALTFGWIPLYHAVAAVMGGGFGYRKAGLRIVRRSALFDRYPTAEELSSQRPGVLRGVLRTVVAYAGVVCLGIGYLWMFTNRERRTWHDLAAGTVVVRVR